ncbi:jg24144 [Pararge aegeria aegeria]|uniref:Jg24144 protein n=1 Tax=Pararge aegeria aegeria TaxID=348720 RepID=A0A8S4RIZ9_9NEOP|nr:jg24144 [Pararge aegeria aegeria]
MKHRLTYCSDIVAEQRAAYLASPASLPEALGDLSSVGWSDLAGSCTSGTTYNGRFRLTKYGDKPSERRRSREKVYRYINRQNIDSSTPISA